MLMSSVFHPSIHPSIHPSVHLIHLCLWNDKQANKYYVCNIDQNICTYTVFFLFIFSTSFGVSFTIKWRLKPISSTKNQHATQTSLQLQVATNERMNKCIGFKQVRAVLIETCWNNKLMRKWKIFLQTFSWTKNCLNCF